MIHPWQRDLTLVSKAELQYKEENHPGLSVCSGRTEHLLVSKAPPECRWMQGTLQIQFTKDNNTGSKKLIKGSSYCRATGSPTSRIFCGTELLPLSLSPRV